MSDTTTTTSKTRTITLTDRPPVKIIEDDWPVMATAKDYEPRNGIEVQANRTWRLVVRQHRTDGRTLVYGVYSSQYQGERARRGGELLTPPAGSTIPTDDYLVWDEIQTAIHRVAAALEFDRTLADACIADLPAEEI